MCFWLGKTRLHAKFQIYRPLTSNHQCDSESDSDDEDDEEEQVAPKGKILDAVQDLQEAEAMYKMLLQINASNPFMKKNSDW